MTYPKIGIVGKPYIGNMDYDWNEYVVISGNINSLISENCCVPIGITNVTTRENLNKEDCHDEHELSEEEQQQINVQIEGLDGIILQGGIQTLAYEEYIAKQAMDRGIPIMGICAGFNVIIRASGGTIVKNNSGSHDKEPTEIAHKIDIEPESNLSKLMNGENEIGVNSVHWMIAKKDGIPQNKFDITAVSKDGLVEAIEGKDGRPIYGYKFHPEVMATKGTKCYNENMVNIFTDFFGKCREYTVTRKQIERQTQQSEVIRLQQEIKDKEEEISTLKEKTQRLQTMLNKTLKFADTVRSSRFGRFFFRNKLRSLPPADVFNTIGQENEK